MKFLLGIWYILVLVVGFAGIFGWIWNVVKLFSTHDLLPFIARLVGIFIPIIGAIYGYF